MIRWLIKEWRELDRAERLMFWLLLLGGLCTGIGALVGELWGSN
jgi:hypothetical protein